MANSSHAFTAVSSEANEINLTVWGSTNGNTSISKALLLGGAYGAVGTSYGAISGAGAFTWNFETSLFTMPAHSQIRGIGLTANGEWLGIGYTGTNAPNSTQITQMTAHGDFINPAFQHFITDFTAVTPSIVGTLFAENVSATEPGASAVGALNGNVNGPGYIDLSNLGLTDLNWNDSALTPTQRNQQGIPSIGFFQWIFYYGSDQFPTANLYAPWTLNIYYNQAPSTGTFATGGVSGTAAIETLTPTVTWAYTDPEGDAQAGYVINIVNNLGATIYNSGFQAGPAQTWTVPSGLFQNNSEYGLSLQVSDAGSNNRLSPATSLMVTTVIDPILMPAFTPQFNLPGPSAGTHPTQPSYLFNSTTGGLGSLQVTARPNLLSEGDAQFEDPENVTGGQAGWTLPVSGFTYVPFPNNELRGLNSLALSCNAAGNCTISNLNNMAVTPGQIYCFQIHTTSTATSGNYTSVASISFYDSTSTLIVTINRTNNFSQTAAGDIQWTKCYVMATAPSGSVTATVAFTINSAVTSTTYYFDAAAFNAGMLNLVDDSSFESALGTTAPSPYWNSGKLGVPSAIDADENLAIGSQSVGILSESGVSSTLSTSITRGGAVVTPISYAVQGSYYLMSVSQTIAPSAPTAIPNVLFGLGRNTPFSTTVGAFIANHTPPSTGWQRYCFFADMSAASSAPYSPAITTGWVSGAGLAYTYNDNIQVEPYMRPLNLGFETGSGRLSAYALPGEPATSWFDESDYAWLTSANAQYSTAQHHSGTQSLLLTSLNTHVPKASQLMSVGGYSTVAINFWSMIPSFFATAIWQATISFFDQGGNQLWMVNPSGTGYIQTYEYSGAQTTGSFTQQTLQTIAVPVGASYMRLSFIGDSSDPLLDNTSHLLYIDDVSCTFTGTIAGSPYLDGGWSGGSVATFPTGVYLKRSYDNGATWTNVRSEIDSPTDVPVPINNTLNESPVVLFNDWEYQPPLSDSPDYVGSPNVRPIYQALMTINSAIANNVSLGSPSRSFYRPQATDWTIVDPTSLTFSTPKLKSFKASTTEQLAKLSPLGRDRIVVIGDTVQGDTISLETYTFSSAEDAAILAQILKQSCLVLRSPYGEVWYVRPTKRDRSRTWTGQYSTRWNTHTIELTEIDPLP